MNQVGSEDAETMVIHYAYDDLYRLTNADYTGAITATYAYDYDAVGNMTAFTETVNTVTSVVTRTFDAANRLETALIDEKLYTYAYDDNGNLLEALFDGDPMFPGGESGDCYDYNQRNLLTVVCTIGPANHVQVEYGYDGAGNRLWRLDRTGGGDPITTTYTNDVFGLTQVLVADDGTDQVYNLFGLDLIQQDDDSTVRTLLVDGLGSVRVETAGGSVGAVTTYSPYGEVLSQSGASGTVYGFTGEQEDEATGLLYLRARYYNSELKSFMSRDPWKGSGWRPGTLNYYGYGLNNPALFTDPSGRIVCLRRGPRGECLGLRNPFQFEPIDMASLGSEILDWLRNTGLNLGCDLLGCWCEVENNVLQPTSDLEWAEAQVSNIVGLATPLSAVKSSTVRVFRVEGSVNARISILKDGMVKVQDNNRVLFLNFGDENRAAEFFEKRVSQGLDAVSIKSFEVSEDFLSYLRQAAVPEQLAREFPNAPIAVDVTKALDQYGLRPQHIEMLIDAIIQGTGKVQP